MNAKRRKYWLGFTVLALLISGSILLARWDSARRLRAALSLDAQRVLAAGEPFILYSLDYAEPTNPETGPDFHGYRIVGQTQVTNARTRADLLGALYGGIGKGDPQACFMPRHGIRAGHGKQTVDLLICFECDRIEIYDEFGDLGASVQASAQPVLDRVLTDAHVSLKR